MPRHPPCALSSLSCYKDARVHCVVLKLRAVPSNESALARRPVTVVEVVRRGDGPRESRSLDPSGPNSVLGELRDASSDFHAGEPAVLTRSCPRTDQIVDVPLVSIVCRRTSVYATDSWTPRVTTDCQMLLRKEVIQPHLPVRLPCYDFVPIASPTFDGSLHKGWATGFGCCRLS